MNFGASAILPNRIRGQIAILILLSLVAIHAVITASFLWNRGQFDPPSPPGPGSEIATVIRAIAAGPRTDRAEFLSHLATAFPGLNVASWNGEIPEPAGTSANSSSMRLLRHLGPGFHISAIPASAGNPDRGERLLVRLPDGDIITLAPLRERSPPLIGGPLAMTVLFVVISITLLVLWAARSLTRPLTDLADAAESFSPDGDVAAIPERGPAEIRSAARALNRMRSRVKALVDDRTRMLAAMEHDLRTPITRLRLRSEFIADEMLRGQMLHDLDQMKSMIDSALTYLRDSKSREEISRIDIATLLQSVCDQHADLGDDVSYSGPDHVAIQGRLDALRRAIANLVDNAVRYAGSARVRLSIMADAIRIDVEDDGPGIADAAKADMLEPFMRGDAARNMDDTHGFGLGLAIAHAVAQTHGGALTLHDRQPRGLIARIEIGRDQAKSA
jgi:signal transduction histidine kinase